MVATTHIFKIVSGYIAQIEITTALANNWL